MQRERTIIVTTVDEAERLERAKTRALTGDERLAIGESLRWLYDPFGKRGGDGSIPRLQRILRIVERP
jgi:hypothetical protein